MLKTQVNKWKTKYFHASIWKQIQFNKIVSRCDSEQLISEDFQTAIETNSPI